MKRCHQLCLFSVNLVAYLAKNITASNSIELFSTLHFLVKHGESVSATNQQQTHYASNLEYKFK